MSGQTNRLKYFQRPLALATQSKSYQIALRPAPTSFRPTYNQNHDPRLNYLIWQTDWVGHIFHDRTLRAARDRPRDCLWWTVAASLNISKKSAVRRWATRRISNAFRAALQEKGFDQEGRVEENGLTDLRQDLRGSLRMDITARSLINERTVIETEMRRLVEQLSSMKPPRQSAQSLSKESDRLATKASQGLMREDTC